VQICDFCQGLQTYLEHLMATVPGAAMKLPSLHLLALFSVASLTRLDYSGLKAASPLTNPAALGLQVPLAFCLWIGVTIAQKMIRVFT
jgi:hypothetical protein